jgi:hypothetical protein
MVASAAERATQIQPTGVAGMREKPYPALHAASYATLQVGMRPQDRVQRGLILTDKRLGAIILVPIWSKRENSLDGYGKKAKLSVTIFRLSCTPSSYFIEARASRGRARFSMRYCKGSPQPVGATDPSLADRSSRSSSQNNAVSLLTPA